MPRVTRLGGQQIAPAARPTPLSRPSPSPAALGAQLGNTIAQFGLQEFGRLQALERQRANEVAVLAGENGMSEWLVEMLEGKDGWLSQLGVDAFELNVTSMTKFDEKKAELESGLATDEQRIRFDRIMAGVRNRLMFQIGGHVADQRTAFDADQTESGINNAVNDAGAGAGNPLLEKLSLIQVERLVNEWADRNGVPKNSPQREERLLAERTRVHVAIMNSHLSAGNDQLARIYFEESGVQRQMTGGARDQMRDELREGSTRGESQRQADRIMLAAATPTEARAMVRDIENPEIREATVRLVNRRIAENEEQKAREHQQTMIDLGNVLDEQGIEVVMRGKEWVGLNVTEKQALERYAERHAVGDDEGDGSAWYAQMRMAAEDPTRFTSFDKNNLWEQKGKLSDAEFRQLTNLQLARQGSNQAKIDEGFGDFRTIDRMILQAGAEGGIDLSPTQSSKAGREASSFMYREVARRGAEQERVTGKPPDKEAYQVIIDDILSNKATIAGRWYGGFVGGVTFLDRQVTILDLTIDDVPKADQATFRARLLANGQVPTDAAVIRLHHANLLKEAPEEEKPVRSRVFPGVRGLP